MQPQKILLSLFIVLILLGNNALVSASNEPPDVNRTQPKTNGKSVVLMDASSGRILYENNCHERLSPASLTKIMTGLLVVENGDLNKEVKVSEYAASIPECTIYLEPGETLSRMELLYAVMLHSANDASTALAESVAGNETSFVKLMNQRASQLGLEDTRFSNPHGLETTEHYSSAYDLALLSRKALSEQTFAKITETKQMLIPWAGHDENRVLTNMNRLLYRYDGTIGVKTGYTKEAGNCVVGAVQKNDMMLIAVSMNSPTVYDDLINMLDYGFDNYQMISLGNSQHISQTVKVIEGATQTITVRPVNNLMMAVTQTELPYLSYSLLAPQQLTAPVKKGNVLGACKLFINGKQVASIDLLASQSVNKKIPVSHLVSLGQWMAVFVTKWYFYFAVLILGVLLYKQRKKISFEECLRQFFLLLLRKKIQRMKETGKFRF